MIIRCMHALWNNSHNRFNEHIYLLTVTLFYPNLGVTTTHSSLIINQNDSQNLGKTIGMIIVLYFV